MRTLIGLLALVSTAAPAWAGDLDQRRTLTVEDEWMSRVMMEPLTQHPKRAKKSAGEGMAYFHGGVDPGPVIIKRIARKNGTKVLYRVRNKKGVGSRVKGWIRTTSDGTVETLQNVRLRVRGLAPRRNIKGVDGSGFLLHDDRLVVPSVPGPYLQVIHDETLPELTALARLRVAPNGNPVVVGHIGVQVDGGRERQFVERATRWTVRPGIAVDEEYLGPDAGVALDLGPRALLVAGRMDHPGTTDSDALWIENGNGFRVTSFGEPASGPVFEATHVAGDTDGELISVLRVLTGGVGAVRWSSVSGETVLDRPRETVGHTVRAMNDAGDLLAGDAFAEGRAIISVPTLWDAAGDATVLPLGRDAAGRVSALSPDGTWAAGLFLDFFTDGEPVDRHVVWDTTRPEAPPITMRTAFGVRADGFAANAGPSDVTATGTVVGWDAEGGFVWRSDWPSAIGLRAYLEAADLSLPEGTDRLIGAVDVVGGTVLAGSTTSGSGDRQSHRHWVALVPDTITLPAPR